MRIWGRILTTGLATSIVGAQALTSLALADADARYCDARSASVESRSLVFGSTSTPLVSTYSSPGAANPIRRAPRSTELFYYTIPATSFDSGVLVVKVAHHGIVVARYPNETYDQIHLIREAYESRCRQTLSAATREQNRADGLYDSYDRYVGRQDYVDYHYYKKADPIGDPNLSMDRFHAELGDRHIREYWGWRTAAVCARTNLDAILGQFLYDSERTTAGFFPFIGNVAGGVISNATPARAHADTYPGYKDYIGHTTRIIPYRKVAGSKGCIRISVDMPDTSIVRYDYSEVSVLDADDALLASGKEAGDPNLPDEARFPADPQRTWRLNWSAR